MKLEGLVGKMCELEECFVILTESFLYFSTDFEIKKRI